MKQFSGITKVSVELERGRGNVFGEAVAHYFQRDRSFLGSFVTLLLSKLPLSAENTCNYYPQEDNNRDNENTCRYGNIHQRCMRLLFAVHTDIITNGAFVSDACVIHRDVGVAVAVAVTDVDVLNEVADGNVRGGFYGVDVVAVAVDAAVVRNEAAVVNVVAVATVVETKAVDCNVRGGFEGIDLVVLVVAAAVVLTEVANGSVRGGFEGVGVVTSGSHFDEVTVRVDRQNLNRNGIRIYDL